MCGQDFAAGMCDKKKFDSKPVAGELSSEETKGVSASPSACGPQTATGGLKSPCPCILRGHLSTEHQGKMASTQERPKVKEKPSPLSCDQLAGSLWIRRLSALQDEGGWTVHSFSLSTGTFWNRARPAPPIKREELQQRAWRVRQTAQAGERRQNLSGQG